MDKTVILYKSKYGATKKYAGWMKEELNCPVFEIDHFNWREAGHYNLIIVAGGIYATSISGLKQFRKYQNAVSGKAIIFAIGASPFDEANFEQMKRQNLKGISEKIPVFYGRGAYDEAKMNFRDRTMCQMLKKMIQKNTAQPLEPWMEALLASEGEGCDWTNKDYLEPVFRYIREL